MLDGKPYFNKPPVYFWLVALSFKLFGVSFYASKLPSLLFATVNIFFLYWIVYRWFEDYDLAFFSAFSFTTTRWIVINFTSNRPESLLVFSVLLGCYAVYLMNAEDKKGPYLFGLSLAAGFMTKLFFAFFLPAAVFLYGLISKRLYKWSRWAHFYAGITLGLMLASLWFIYYEIKFPGYINYIFNTQTLQRVTGGLDVNTDPFMYLKEIAKYYQPWLIFFLGGLSLLSKKLRTNEYYWLVFLTIIIMLVPLQAAKGKASRYLALATPFLSIVTAIGVCHFERVRKFINGLVLYSIVPLLVFFWIVPVKVNPEKFHVIHLAERLSKSDKVDYTDSLAFVRDRKDLKAKDFRFVEWTPFDPGMEYRLVYDFYLSGKFTHWTDADLQNWNKGGQTAVLLLTSPRAIKILPHDSARWFVLDTDKYHALLLGVRN